MGTDIHGTLFDDTGVTFFALRVIANTSANALFVSQSGSGDALHVVGNTVINGPIVANGTVGLPGQVLHTKGTIGEGEGSVYWAYANGAGGGVGDPEEFVWRANNTGGEIWRELTGFKEGANTYVVRGAEIRDGDRLFRIELAAFTPLNSVVATPASTLDWDVAVTGFTVSVTNPDDFTDSYINDVLSIARLTGNVHPVLGDYTAGSKSATPAGGVDWTQTFSTTATANIISTSTTIAGGSSSARITLQANEAGANTVWPSTIDFTVTWRTPTTDITMTNLTGQTFLETYTSTPYTVTTTNITTPGTVSHSVSATGGSESNSSGSGTLTFTTPFHKDNTGTSVSMDVDSTFTRPSGVAETSYSALISDSDPSLVITFTYPSFTSWTIDTFTNPTSSIIVNGTSYDSANNVATLGNQTKNYSGYVNNANGTPRAFWFGVRSAATQPTSFQTGPSPSLLTDTSYVSNTIPIQPTSPPAGYTAENFDIYGITLQPGSTYVSIS